MAFVQIGTPAFEQPPPSLVPAPPPPTTTDPINKQTGSASEYSKEDYAMLSNAVYNKGDAKNVEGWNIDQSLSNDDVTTYVDPATGKVIQSYRGTDLKHPKRGWKDFQADIGELTGYVRKTTRFKEARRMAQAAADKYGKDNVSVTGHSLGGAIANDVSSSIGLQAYSFNPLVGYTRIYDEKNKQVDYSKVHQFSNPHDPVSLLSAFENKKAFQEIQGAPTKTAAWEDIAIGTVGIAASVVAGAEMFAKAAGWVAGEETAAVIAEDASGTTYRPGYNRVATEEDGIVRRASNRAVQLAKKTPLYQKVGGVIGGDYVYDKAKELVHNMPRWHGMGQYVPSQEEYHDIVTKRHHVRPDGTLVMPNSFIDSNEYFPARTGPAITSFL